MKWLRKLFRKLLGIKSYQTCPTCKMVYEPDGTPFDGWCPEHRKSHEEMYELKEWAKDWALRNPFKARELRSKENADAQKLHQEILSQWAKSQTGIQAASAYQNQGLGNLHTKG